MSSRDILLWLRFGAVVTVILLAASGRKAIDRGDFKAAAHRGFLALSMLALASLAA